MSQRDIVRDVPPLPEKIEDWVRHIKAERTLNDLVEDVHRVLVNESDQYRAYLRAVDDRKAVTGSLSFDNCKACEMIQKKAHDMGNTEVAEELLGVINSALGVVLRRYKASRKQRRNMLGGQLVPTADENNNDGG
jgi:uncharacterized protein YigA (DUF484 family)